MRRLALALTLLSAGCSAGSETRKPDAEPAGAQEGAPPIPTWPGTGIVRVTYVVSAASSRAVLRIDGAGNLRYDARTASPQGIFDTEESRTHRLLPTELQELATMVSQSRLFALPQEEWQPLGQDCTGYSLTVTSLEKSDTFYCLCRCPPELERIAGKLEELLGRKVLAAAP